LLLPVIPLFIITPDSKGLADLLILLDLRLCYLVYLMRLQSSRIRSAVLAALSLGLELLAQGGALVFYLILVDAVVSSAKALMNESGTRIPFVLEAISELEDFDLDFSFAVVLEDLLVRLSLLVLELVEVLRIWRYVVAGLEVREIALDIAGCAATARRR